MAFVLQDVFLFEGSVKDNLTLGRSEVDEITLRRALETANAVPVVDRLRGGLEEQRPGARE